MNHKLFTVAILVVLATTSQAQEPSVAPTNIAQQGPEKRHLSPAEKAKKDADRAEKKLGLTAEQKQKWEAASLERAVANQPIREKMKGCTTPDERKAYHSQMRVNHKKYKSTTLDLLTTEQKTKYETMQKVQRMQHKARMKERHRADTE